MNADVETVGSIGDWHTLGILGGVLGGDRIATVRSRRWLGSVTTFPEPD